ncbi:MAG: hypothetical protein EA426_17825 [Spirochaetaceae bacterium]|nr:MAG: hypothetical protein EA426_17825 [Spirochaetaceae bacterium]
MRVLVLVTIAIIVMASCVSFPPESVYLSDAAHRGGTLEPLSLADPGIPGPLSPAMLVYGGGHNPRRPEYSLDVVDIRTTTVDVSAFVDTFEDHYWGYTAEAVPLNGRIFYPTEPGVYPVVVMVHGNHPPYRPSERGYDYLGRHLASHGMIFASIDQTFLNGLSGENDARGIVLLEHAKLILGWNDDPSNPLFGQINTDQVAVAGHSRGGEAAVHAAVFNRFSAYPDDVTVPFEYGLPIRAVISVAPIEGQYRPADRSLTVPPDVDYLVLHGSHDGDVSEHFGLRFVNRAPLPGAESSPDAIRAGIWIYGANHGQFNTEWSPRQDPFATLRGNLLSADEQRRIAVTTITALLLAAFDREPGYREFLAAPERGRGWLPQTRYVTQFSDNTAVTIADFDDDPFLETATLHGWAVEVEGFASARERRPPFSSRGRVGADGWAFVGRWNDRSDGRSDEDSAEDASILPSLRLIAADSGDAVHADRLAFDITRLAPARLSDEATREPLDVSVRVRFSDGAESLYDVSEFALVSYGPRVTTVRGSMHHNIPQTVVLPIGGRFDTSGISSVPGIVAIEFLFDAARAGSVAIDNVRYYRAEEGDRE